MKLTTEEVYKIVYDSLTGNPEDWTHSTHMSHTSKGVKIPYTIHNNEIGVSIWISNGFTFCDITLVTNQITGINLFKK